MDASAKLYEIDPNGDTLIVLKNPNTALLEWKTREEGAELQEAPEQDKESAEVEERAENASLEVRFLVSSRQLRIVSPYFDNMFRQEYTETVPDPEDGLYHIQAEGWSDEALAVVLSTVHVQMNGIPETVNSALLANIFVIADYYRTDNVLELYTIRWKHDLDKTSNVSSYSEEAVLLMFLGLKFKDRDLFMTMASMIMKKTWGPIQFLDLPFPSGVQVCKLDGMRCNAIQKLLEGVHDLIRKLYEGEVGCSEQCVAMLLGTMMRGLRSAGLLVIVEVPDQRPFNGVSFGELLASFRTIRTPYNTSRLRNACCQIEGFLRPICDEAVACMKIQPSDFGF